jgi:predicted transcriptional regulator
MSVDPVIIIITLTSTLGPIIIALNKSIKSCNCFCFKCEKFDLQKDELQDENKDKNENKKSFFKDLVNRISPRKKKEKEIQSENLNLDYELNELNKLKNKVHELKENKNDHKVYDLE